MGFLNGRVSFLRFQVDGPKPRLFTDEHLDQLRANAVGASQLASADGIECGWATGEHALDTAFDGSKNIINDSLHFELRIDTDKPPSDLLKSYTVIELKALAAMNPSGFPSARQKREAKEHARARLDEEAKDGRFKKRKCIPVLWDAKRNEVLYGSTSLTQIERLMALFERTFGCKLIPLTASRQAAEVVGAKLSDITPSVFIPGISPPDVAWIADEISRDFLGNEFFLWLWWHAESEGDTITLSDGSECTFMISGGLRLECPRGQTGSDVINHEGPTRMPESKRAIQTGKLPRQIGLILVRRDEQYNLKWSAETLSVGSAKLPNTPDDVVETRAKLDCRIDQIRDLVETVDLLFDRFVSVRTGTAWPETLAKMQSWLARAERRAAA